MSFVLCINRADIKADTRVFVRCDLDVPLHEGRIGETFRLNACLKTLSYISNRGAIPVIAGHIGRPHGRFVATLSTKYLQVYFTSHLRGRFEVLENLRFDIREEIGDPSYAEELARNIQLYVNESFATCHRNSASITGLPRLLPAFAGFQLTKEVEMLNKVLYDPPRPLTVIVGGAKVESKAPLIAKFADVADCVLVGGKVALELKPSNNKVRLPVDYVDTMDIGSRTLEAWRNILLGSKTIVWAGPMGMFEDERYQTGTKSIAEIVAQAVSAGSFGVVGGGDTITALTKFGLTDKFSFISTGGSAMLEYLVAGNLPGIQVLH
ncbi:TPA: hypothetical protein DCY43_01135 [candidate division WWE3 bacterium]|uniref:Phosphoglycerate kinase n=2 Tax=Katanobacteria TaxID=422282 RepID=A0A0G1KNB1_UNCKA|nr:MAG: Phosphoglycerate kinase [candidate division WWE3 bacterium GW2011_GWC2_44_9]HAZ29346.1 hypothetical protein [candidate division WWE3 bacterium]